MTTIRPANSDDIEALVDLVGEFFDDDAESFPTIYASESREERFNYIRSVLAEPVSHLDVALVDGRIVGLCAFDEARTKRLGFARDNHITVHLISVTKDHRRQGIAKRLLNSAHDWAKANGFAAVRLNVWEHNAGAQSFYATFGYQTITRRLAVDLNSTREPD